MTKTKYSVQDDFMVKGFHKLDDTIIELKAPRLTELPKFAAKSEGQKYLYYRKIAATMNHAAKLISEERDELNRLIKLKEQQLIELMQQMDRNNLALAAEVTKFNEQRQSYNHTIGILNEKVKRLENGHDA